MQELANEDFTYSGKVINKRIGDTAQIFLTFNESLLTGGSSQLRIEGTDAYLRGELGTQTYLQIRDLIASQPQVKRLVIEESAGSVNDEINVHTGRLIRAAKLATPVPATSDIHSGAVDLFTAGVARSADVGAVLGVHAWCCTNKGRGARRLPRDSIEHGMLLTYFRAMLPLQGEEFYFFHRGCSGL